MTEQMTLNYGRIAEAIHYINTHFKTQPGLEEVARQVHLSPFHFQKLFSEWAGTSPKKFLQYISTEYAKKMLREEQATLAETAAETGLSGTGRLHDLFIHIEGMTPAEYKNGGRSLSINYSFAGSPFGNILIASTSRGVCHLAFAENNEALATLQIKFPNAVYNHKRDELQQDALSVLTDNLSYTNPVKLHLRGTDFQLKVWQALLKIPMGKLSSYGRVAHAIGHNRASRAVGTAIGSNPVAFLIPCHRVIQSTGILGGYMWGLTRKTAMIGWEASRTKATDI